MSWFPFSLLSVLFFGITVALQKSQYARGRKRFVVFFWVMISQLLSSVLFFGSHIGAVSLPMVGFAAIWGSFFAVIAFLHLRLVQDLAVNTAFPLTSTASLFVTVVLGLILFNETITALQGVGIILMLVVLYSYVYVRGKLHISAHLLGLMGIIILASASSKLIHKFAAGSYDIFAFQVYQYIFGLLIGLVLLFFFSNKDWHRGVSLKSVQLGIGMGIFGFLGNIFFLLALRVGPLSLVASVHSFYTFIASLIACVVFREELTRRKLILVLSAILAVLLIRLG